MPEGVQPTSADIGPGSYQHSDFTDVSTRNKVLFMLKEKPGFSSKQDKAVPNNKAKNTIPGNTNFLT